MDDETRKAFAKIDSRFEQNEAEHARTRVEVAEVKQALSALKNDLSELKQLFQSFGDWENRLSPPRLPVAPLMDVLAELEEARSDRWPISTHPST